MNAATNKANLTSLPQFARKLIIALLDQNWLRATIVLHACTTIVEKAGPEKILGILTYLDKNFVESDKLSLKCS